MIFIRPHVGPFLNGLPGAIFQQDNARPHTARVAQDILRHFQTLPWPTRSPNLSPVEHGRELLEDDARPGQAHRVITPEMIAEVNALVLDNCRITMEDIHRLLGISVSTTHTIMHQHLNFRKICAQWVPNQLTAEQRNTRMALSLNHLQRYHEEKYGFLCRKLSLVTKHEVTILNPKASLRAQAVET
ncbi:uncharacterized protein TNCV_2711731 [Trichonephila clavipes]|nr:uncharacterized protein TNCV_2711731 [Trichonephila clavipes]